MKIAYIGPTSWDEPSSHGKTLAKILARHWSVTYLEPLGTSWNRTVERKARAAGRYQIADRLVAVRRGDASTPLRFGLQTEIGNLREIARQPYDLVVSYLTLGAVSATLFARLRGAKVLLIYADDLPNVYRPRFSSIVTKHVSNPIVARAADCVVGTALKLVDDMKPYNKCAYHIPNGVHLSSFRQQPRGNDSAGHRFTVGYVGGVMRWLDVEMIVAAARALPDARFLIVGGGESLDYARQCAAGLSNVELTGWVSHDRVPDLVAQMDVCTIPFRVSRLTDRVSPIKLFEYWAMRKPVVTTRFHEVVQCGEGAAAFVDDITHMVSTLRRLRDDAALRDSLAQEGWNRVQAYDWEVLGQRYVELIGDLLGVQRRDLASVDFA